MANIKYKLSFYEREKLELYHRLKYSKRKMARMIERNHTVIIREFKRNIKPNQKYYNANLAQKLADRREEKRNKVCKLDKDEILRQYVIDRITKDEWSPQQIAAILKNHPPDELQDRYVCHESIYLYIYNSSSKYLYKSLRRKKAPKRQKRFSRKKQVTIRIPERIGIQERNECINSRARYGDWESDTIQFSKQKSCLSVQHERKSLLIRIHKVVDKSSEETKEAIRKSMETIPIQWQQSMTFDNGKENVEHTIIKDEYGIETYFCDSYCSWQKGGVENSNGLIRQYLPKKIEIDKVSEKAIYEIQEKINNRPRKKLGYLTPNQIFNKFNGALVN